MADLTVVNPTYSPTLGYLATMSHRLVAVSATNLFFFYIDGTAGDPEIRLTISTDSGATWGASTLIASHTSAITLLEVWYDKWTPGLTGGNIHVVFTRTTQPPIGLFHVAVEDVFGIPGTVRELGNVFPETVNAAIDKLTVVKDKDNDLWVAAYIDGGFSVFYNAAGDGSGTWTTPVSDTASITGQTDIGQPDYVADPTHISLLPGFGSDQPILIAWDAANARIVALQWDTTNDEFVWMADMATGQTGAPANTPLMGCGQRDGDLAVFVAYAASTDPPQIRMLSMFDFSSAVEDHLIHESVVLGDDIRYPQVYCDFVNGHIMAAWLEGDAVGGSLAAWHAKSVNSGFNWEDLTQYSAGSDDKVALAAPLNNHNAPGLFLLVWYDAAAELWEKDDSNDILDGLYTVSDTVVPAQEVVSCLTGNP